MDFFKDISLDDNMLQATGAAEEASSEQSGEKKDRKNKKSKTIYYGNN